MKVLALGLSLLTAVLLPAAAQVTVQVTQDQDQFLPGEELNAAVRITNRSGQPLRLGQGEDWLSFSIQGREEEVVPKLGEVPVEGEFTLDSSKVVTKHVNLSPYFALSHAGHYTITAVVRLKNWNQVITSPPKGFDIIEGAKLWEQDVGVPVPEGVTNALPEVRKYILQQANYLKKELRLYVRLTDGTGTRTFRVIVVGPMVSFGHPETQVDRLSRLHILHQQGPRTFLYTVVTPDGEVFARRTYDYGEKRPRLQQDMGGQIIVSGGMRRPSKSDIPSDASSPDAPKGKPTPPVAPGEMMPPG